MLSKLSLQVLLILFLWFLPALAAVGDSAELSLVPKRDQLIGYFPFDSVAQLNNQVEYSYRIKSSSSHKKLSSGPYGVANTSFTVTADSEFARIAFSTKSVFTVSFFFKSSLTKTGGIIQFWKLDKAKGICEITYSPPNVFEIGSSSWNSNWRSFGQYPILEADTWKFLAVARANRNVKIFDENGNVLGEANNITERFDTDLMVVGHARHGAAGFVLNANDHIACLSVHQTLLTAEEVRQLPRVCDFRNLMPLSIGQNDNFTANSTTLVEDYSYFGAKDNSKWSVACNANYTGDVIQLEPPSCPFCSVGSMISNKALTSASLNFQLEVTISFNVVNPGTDGFAIYITRRSWSHEQNQDAAACQLDTRFKDLQHGKSVIYGLSREAKNSLAIKGISLNRVFSVYSLFPNNTDNIVWQWVRDSTDKETNAKYPTEQPFLGNCNFDIWRYNFVTVIVRYNNKQLSVSYRAYNSSDGPQATGDCVGQKNLSSLYDEIATGQAVIQITAGYGDVHRCAHHSVTNVRFFEILQTTTTTTTTSTVTTTPTTTTTTPVTTMPTTTTTTSTVTTTPTTTTTTPVTTTSKPTVSSATSTTTITMSKTPSTTTPTLPTIPSMATTMAAFVENTWTQVQETVQNSAEETASPKAVGIAEKPKEVVEALLPPMPAKLPSIPKWPLKEQLIYCKDQLSPSIFAPPNSGMYLNLKINVAFAIDRLVDMDTILQKIKTSAAIIIHWQVDTCRLRPEEYNKVVPGAYDYFAAHYDRIWKPTYLYETSVSDIFMANKIDFQDDLIGTLSTGDNPKIGKTVKIFDLFLVRRGIFSNICNLDLTKFPFDEQQCNHTFRMELPSEYASFHNPVVFCPSDGNTEWHFLKCERGSGLVAHAGGTSSVVYFVAYLERRPMYYVLNVIVPNLLLAVLMASCFLIPANEPHRAIFAATILLSLLVSLFQSLTVVPKTSQAVPLVRYMIQLNLFGAASTAYHLIAFSIVKAKKMKKMSNPHFDVIMAIILTIVFLIINANFFKLFALQIW